MAGTGGCRMCGRGGFKGDSLADFMHKTAVIYFESELLSSGH